MQNTNMLNKHTYSRYIHGLHNGQSSCQPLFRETTFLLNLEIQGGMGGEISDGPFVSAQFLSSLHCVSSSCKSLRVSGVVGQFETRRAHAGCSHTPGRCCILDTVTQPQVPVTQELAKSDAFVMIQVASIEIWAIISTAKPEHRQGRKR